MDIVNNTATVQNNPPPLPPPPRAINILHRGNGYVLDESVLRQILLHPKYADKKVCIVSIVGPSNKGKSYLFNFFLRYLEWYERPADEKSKDWLENDGGNLDGFEWKNSSENTTTGIQIWSKPFIIKNQKNEEIVVLLIDTEGCQRSGTTYTDDAIIYVLASMLSSIQIYNVPQKIDDRCLEHLWMGVEYQKLIFKENYFNEKPFSPLLFLIRYWSCPYEAEYGVNGGQKMLKKIFKESKKKEELRNGLVKTVEKAYEKMSCFLMPHPGAEALEHKEFKVEVIEKEFLKNLRKLISTLFDPENVVVKKVNNQEVTCREFYEHFKKNITPIFEQYLPHPRTWYHVCAEAYVEEAKSHYISKMEKLCGSCNPRIFEKHHKIYSVEALKLFKIKPKTGNEKWLEFYVKKLENEITEQYKVFCRQNTEIFKKQGFIFDRIFYWIRENFCQCISF